VLNVQPSNLTLMHNSRPQGAATVYSNYGDTIDSSKNIGLNKYKLIAAEK
jgi:hypothetical protein